MSFCGVKVSGASHTRGPPWGGRFPGFRLFSAFRGRRFQVPFTLGHPYHKDWRPESRQPLHGRHPLRVGTPRSTAQKNCPVGLSWTPGVYSASHRKFCPQGYISIESAKPGAFFFAKKDLPLEPWILSKYALKGKTFYEKRSKGRGLEVDSSFFPLESGLFWLLPEVRDGGDFIGRAHKTTRFIRGRGESPGVGHRIPPMQS